MKIEGNLSAISRKSIVIDFKKNYCAQIYFYSASTNKGRLVDWTKPLKLQTSQLFLVKS